MVETAVNSPLAVPATKQLVKLCLEVPMHYDFKLGLGITDTVWGSEDAVKGSRAFAEKTTSLETPLDQMPVNDKPPALKVTAVICSMRRVRLVV